MIRPSLLKKLQRSSLYIIAVLVGTLIGAGLDLADKVLKATDRVGWTKSEAFVLATASDRSKFSDAFTRSAYRRLILADIFARRVQDSAPSAAIEDAWKSYVSALIDWNSDLMINIVGLETFYDARKSAEFETTIQSMYRSLDQAMRSVYLAPAMANLRSHPDQRDDLSGLQNMTDAVFQKTDSIRFSLYYFIRCFKQGEAKQKSAGCDITEQPQNTTLK